MERSVRHDDWPAILVVIPCLNHGRYLRQALDSIVVQKYPRLQVVVMDGGSADESVAVIKEFEHHIHHWHSGPDGGQSAAINQGFAYGDGELFCWLNADDFFINDALWLVGKAARVLPDCGVYIGNGYRFDEASQTRKPFSLRSLGFDRRALREGFDFVQQPSTFYRRAAWQEAGGLERELCFGMDWDLLIRVTKHHKVALINEFISCSREYPQTKTASGGLPRAIELCEIGRRHAGNPFTVGTFLYLLETMRGIGLTRQSAHVLGLFGATEGALRADLERLSGHSDGFPSRLDPGDRTFVPLATSEPRLPARPSPHDLPLISIITPSFNQAAFLPRTLSSVAAQNYARLEHIVVDGGSTDDTVAILKTHAAGLAHWDSEPDRGPAHAINKGFRRATGEILAWLNSDDMLAEGALDLVARTFAEHPDVDMVFGNAMYVDAADRPILMNQDSSLYYGQMQPLERIPFYWSYAHAVPQATVFFRKRLLERVGMLDESFHFIFDFELFFRFVSVAKIRKIDRILAFYRIHPDAKTSNPYDFFVELYRFSRPLWPERNDPGFRAIRREFADAFLDRESHLLSHISRRLVDKILITAVKSKSFNPEALARDLNRRRQRKAINSRPTVPAGIDRDALEPVAGIETAAGTSAPQYSLLYCGFMLPRYPGMSGGEIRDFHLLNRLLGFCRVGLVSLYEHEPSDQVDPLSSRLQSLHLPSDLEARLPEKASVRAIASPMHKDAKAHAAVARSRAPFVQWKLENEKVDFLIVGPQLNPLGLALAKERFDARLILSTYDIESIRVARMASSKRGIARLAADWDSRKAREFERRNLAVYDGIIAVSEHDRAILVEEFRLDAERVIAIENAVDTGYFTFVERQRDQAPAVLLTGQFGYLPNEVAAVRLIDRIMPMVWNQRADAQVWIVGQQPSADLLRRGDGQRIFVTGKVDSVRPYLRACSVACIPLEIGSGTKLKVLEAIAAGVPAVCTSVAVEGLNLTSEHITVADSDSDLAHAIVETLGHPHAASSTARRARSFVEAHYSWDVTLAKLDEWLARIAKMPRQ